MIGSRLIPIYFVIAISKHTALTLCKQTRQLKQVWLHVHGTVRHVLGYEITSGNVLIAHSTKREKAPCVQSTQGAWWMHTGGRSPELPDCHTPPGKKKLKPKGVWGVAAWELVFKKREARS